MRTIKLSILEAKQAIQSKSRLEALAFAVQIKGMYVSSCLMDCSSSDKSIKYSKLKEQFHLGHAKIKRIINNAIEYGYIRFENGRLIANKLYSTKEFIIRINISSKESLINNSKVKSLIQKTVIIEHINKISFINDQIYTVKHREISYKKKKKAMKKLYEYALTISDDLIGISYNTFCKVANINKNKAISFIKDLISHNVITKSLNFICTGIKAKSKDKTIQIEYKKNGHNGYLRKMNYMYYIQGSNIYSISNFNLIKFS